jgi:PleD family two-component response regulator
MYVAGSSRQQAGMSTTTVTPEPPHVLAVDDSIVDRAVISRLLRSSKYRGAYCLCDYSLPQYHISSPPYIVTYCIVLKNNKDFLLLLLLQLRRWTAAREPWRFSAWYVQ